MKPSLKTKTREIVIPVCEQTATVNAGTSYFFGIGINQYQHFSKLNNAVKDVQDVAALLHQRYRFAKENTFFLLDDQATRENIIAKLDQYVEQIKPEDKLLIYYSGHGHLNQHTKRGYWIPVDAEPGKTSCYINNSNIKNYIEDIPSRHTLLVSDSCFSGTLFVRGETRSVAALNELEQRRSRWALCSGRHDELVYDGAPGQNSPFAASILKVLGRNQYIKINILRLVDEVINLTRAQYRQLPEGNPLFGVGHEGGQFIFQLGEKEHVVSKLKQIPATVPLMNADVSKIQVLETQTYRLRKQLNRWKSRSLVISVMLLTFWLTTIALKNISTNQDLTNSTSESPMLVSEPWIDPVTYLDWEKQELEGLPGPVQFDTIKNDQQNKEKPKKAAITPALENWIINGANYPILSTDNLAWMAKNMNDDIKGSWCYQDSASYCEQYGRLYTWKAAKKTCERLGMRLPSSEEVTELIHAHGDNTAAYKALIQGGSAGFNAQLGGVRMTNGQFRILGNSGGYWTNKDVDTNLAQGYYFTKTNSELKQKPFEKTTALSCRCVQEKSNIVLRP